MKVIDNRIKECLHCGESFEDNTKPGNKKTCSTECARLIKNEKQRMKYRVHNPPKPNQRQLYYLEHLEYPFWSNSEKGDSDYYNNISPYTDKVEYIQARREIEQLIGGRIRHREKIDYNGDEKGSHGVRVQFVKHEQTNPSEIKTYTMSPEELEEYRRSK